MANPINLSCTSLLAIHAPLLTSCLTIIMDQPMNPQDVCRRNLQHHGGLVEDADAKAAR